MPIHTPIKFSTEKKKFTKKKQKKTPTIFAHGEFRVLAIIMLKAEILHH